MSEEEFDVWYARAMSPLFRTWAEENLSPDEWMEWLRWKDSGRGWGLYPEFVRLRWSQFLDERVS